jgi:hypothetical protein
MGDVIRCEVVCKHELHRLETVTGGCSKPVKETVFGVEHGEVGSETQHGVPEKIGFKTIATSKLRMSGFVSDHETDADQTPLDSYGSG